MLDVFLYSFQKQVEDLESIAREMEKEKVALQASLDSAQAEKKPPVQTTDIGVQSQRLQEPVAQPEAAALRPVGRVRPDSPHKRFPKDRIRSPVRLRSHSPKTSSGDLMDSSLDNEMRAAGVDFNDSFDSSEGVGFSDTNIDTSALESDLSLATREEGGDPSKAVDSSPHRTSWTEVTDQAQAKPVHLGTPTISGAGAGVVQDRGTAEEVIGGVEEEVGRRATDEAIGGVEEEVGGSEQSSELSTDKGKAGLQNGVHCYILTCLHDNFQYDL